MGFGRWGDRVANTPRRLAGPRGGRTFGRHVEFLWNHETSQMRSNPSRSLRASSSLES